MDSTPTTSHRSLTRARGVVAGAAAFLVGYAVTYLATARDVQELLGPINALADFLGATQTPAWKVVGWLHFNAHFVAIKIQLGPLGARLIDPIRATDAGLEFLYAVPPFLLLTAGFATQWTADRRAPRSILAGAATVTGGYLLVVVLGWVLFRFQDSGPDLVPAFALAGVAYPAAFGAIGAALANITRRIDG